VKSVGGAGTLGLRCQPVSGTSLYVTPVELVGRISVALGDFGCMFGILINN